jgi:hypothetical protein
MSQPLADALVKHELLRRQEKLKYGWIDLPPWLFVTKAGTPLDPANMRRAMQSLLRKAKLPLHFTPHCLRRTYASILLAEGVSPVYVQEQLGHATIELTVSTYGRWLKKRAHGALDRLDQLPNFDHGSKVVAEAGYSQNPQTGSFRQVPEIPWKSVEPATRIERATCGLRISEKGLLKSLKTWAIPPPALRIKLARVGPFCFPSSRLSASCRFN